jgi:cyclophilin family peptidyl-prolyl cis-trans isomerase
MSKLITLLIIVTILIIVYLGYTCYISVYKNVSDEEIVNVQEETRLSKKNNEFFVSKDEISKEKNLEISIVIDDQVSNIEIKLYDDIVPLTCKNFRHIAKKGIKNKTYNNCIFHRIIKDFMIQGGDIINQDGTGSMSIYGDNFEDENFNIKHTKKGLLSMANSGPNTNGSQFFITTAPTPHLDNKHVVFGEVVNGYDIIEKIENLPTDASDKPYQPVTIKSIKEL